MPPLTQNKFTNINMTIRETVEQFLSGIISIQDLYSDERALSQTLIHEIIAIEVQLSDSSIIHLYDIEQLVYDYGSDTFFYCPNIDTSDSIKDDQGVFISYTLPYALVTINPRSIQLDKSHIRPEYQHLDIVSVKCISKKDASLEDLKARYFEMYHGIGNVFKDTYDFQAKYGLLDNNNTPHFLPAENMEVKIKHLEEELNEIKQAYKNNDIVECADGIMDLIYVAAGLANLIHLPVNELWIDVQNSNMAFKERVQSLNTATKRKSTFDVRKTDRWIAPRGKEIIESAD